MKKRLLIAAALLGVVGLVVRSRMTGRADWEGLTESQAREKLHDRFPDRVPADTRDFVTDKIVTKMRESGRLADDPDEGIDVDLSDTIDVTTDASTEDGVTAST